jgi:proton-coupled amino acid transporter
MTSSENLGLLPFRVVHGHDNLGMRRVSLCSNLPPAMSSPPSRPVDIGSPVRSLRSLRDIGDEDATDAPNVRQRRHQYGTPPAGTTIPRFRGTPGNLTPIAIGSPARSPPPAELFRNTPRPVSPIERGLLGAVSVTDVTKIPSQALPELSEEEKMRVLQRHLVSRDQRFGDEPSRSQGPSRVPSFYPEASDRPSNRSSRASSVYHREDDESDIFPLPFSAPGGDVT